MSRIAWNRNFTIMTCAECGIKKEIPRWKINQHKGIFCSRACYEAHHRKSVVCKKCNKVFSVRMFDFKRGRNKFCSQKCAQIYMIGDKHGSWNGGTKINAYGYIMVWSKRDDRKYQYIHRHCVVLEKQLGRKLKKTEIVHHINGIKNDNRIQNLMLFKNQSSHVRFEHGGKIPIDDLIFNGAMV
jgi:hypothetical protein